jgi:hypothetical protein
MNMIPVNLSNRHAVDYDEAAKVLRIEFKNGGIYDYHNVPANIFISLLNASSHWQYFYRNIKKQGYRFTKRK